MASQLFSSRFAPLQHTLRCQSYKKKKLYRIRHVAYANIRSFSKKMILVVLGFGILLLDSRAFFAIIVREWHEACDLTPDNTVQTNAHTTARHKKWTRGADLWCAINRWLVPARHPSWRSQNPVWKDACKCQK